MVCGTLRFPGFTTRPTSASVSLTDQSARGSHSDKFPIPPTSSTDGLLECRSQQLTVRGSAADLAVPSALNWAGTQEHDFGT